MTAEEALGRVDVYRGSRLTSPAVVAFTRAAVRDALPAAPQPVTRAWISYATSCLGTLAARCEAQGLPLEREVVLDRARIDRFLSHDCAHLSLQSQAGYRSRLDVIGKALLPGQNDAPWPRAKLSKIDRVAPWDGAQAARVGLWMTGARPESRRYRLRTSLAGSLGAGLGRRDLTLVTGDHVTQDSRGVHVVIPECDTKPSRTVTVTAAWEREVLAAAERAGSRLLVAPDRTELDVNALTRSFDTANRFATPGDEFTTTRARNTWLVRQMAAGTPVTVLLAASGLTTVAVLGDLLRFVPAAAADDAAAWLRGTR